MISTCIYIYTNKIQLQGKCMENNEDNNNKKKMSIASILSDNHKEETEEGDYHIGHKNRKVIYYFVPSMDKKHNVILEADSIYTGTKKPNREFYISHASFNISDMYSKSKITLANNSLNIFTNAFKSHYNRISSNILNYANKKLKKARLELKTLAEFVESEFKIEAIDIKNLTPFYRDMINDRLHDLLDHSYMLVPSSKIDDERYIREVEMEEFGGLLYEVISPYAKTGDYRKYTYLELILMDVDFVDVISKYGIYKRIEK